LIRVIVKIRDRSLVEETKVPRKLEGNETFREITEHGDTENRREDGEINP
jgi:hypothetical protein